MVQIVCPVACEYALDVGLPEYAVTAKNGGGCSNCSHYWGEYIEPPVFKYDCDRIIALADIDPFGQPPKCDPYCLYGECGGSPWPGCGGCCRCCGGCQVQHENGQIAPYLWEGTYG